MNSRQTKQRIELNPEAIDRLNDVLGPEAPEAALEGLDPEQITGTGGIITQLAGRMINAALEAEMDTTWPGPTERPARTEITATAPSPRRWRPRSAATR